MWSRRRWRYCGAQSEYRGKVVDDDDEEEEKGGDDDDDEEEEEEKGGDDIYIMMSVCLSEKSLLLGFSWFLVGFHGF